LLGSNGGALNTLSDDAATTVTPVSNNIQLAGTANQIKTTAGSGVITFSLIGPFTPSTFTAHSVLLGEGTSSIGTVGPGTTGIPLIGQGASADPIFGTAIVAGGGTGATTLTSHGVLLGNGTSAVTATTAGTNGQVLLGSTGAAPAFGTLTTSTGIAFTTGAASLALNIKQGGFNLNTVSGTSGTLAAQNMYLCTNAGATTLALPATAAVGDTYLVVGASTNTGGWVITAGAGQTISDGADSTTVSITSPSSAFETVSIICTDTNTGFAVLYYNDSIIFA
jgi:hypothetical protein